MGVLSPQRLYRLFLVSIFSIGDTYARSTIDDSPPSPVPGPGRIDVLQVHAVQLGIASFCCCLQQLTTSLHACALSCLTWGRARLNESTAFVNVSKMLPGLGIFADWLVHSSRMWLPTLALELDAADPGAAGTTRFAPALRNLATAVSTFLDVGRSASIREDTNTDASVLGLLQSLMLFQLPQMDPRLPGIRSTNLSTADLHESDGDRVNHATRASDSHTDTAGDEEEDADITAAVAWRMRGRRASDEEDNSSTGDDSSASEEDYSSMSDDEDNDADADGLMPNTGTGLPAESNNSRVQAASARLGRADVLIPTELEQRVRVRGVQFWEDVETRGHVALEGVVAVREQRTSAGGRQPPTRTATSSVATDGDKFSLRLARLCSACRTLELALQDILPRGTAESRDPILCTDTTADDPVPDGPSHARRSVTDAESTTDERTRSGEADGGFTDESLATGVSPVPSDEVSLVLVFAGIEM